MSVYSDIRECETELRSIARELEDVADDLKDAIIGMSLFKYTWTLENCAEKYRKAANKLSRIKE